MSRDWIDDFEALAEELNNEVFDGDAEGALYYASEQILSVVDKYRNATERQALPPCNRTVGWAHCLRPSIGVDSEGPYCERHKI